MEGMMGLVQKSTPSGYTYLAERSGSSLINKVLDLHHSTSCVMRLSKKEEELYLGEPLRG